ncbi:unnamed protein product [Phaedon cochleariae]|uniref:Ribonucleoside-diphosphate reductase n=1 Tax=Phaedon cochleariae TaxID=80249 RepID=A0A9P0DWU6_PHACE|nr:unnamed protein product [Phaedon cochleariae]
MVSKPTGRMYVFKRGGRKEEVHLDKITSRIQKLCYGLNMDVVDPVSITLKVVNGVYSGVTTTELDTLAAETAITKSGEHPDYATLAARIAISNLHKETKKQFTEVIDDLYDPDNEEQLPAISEDIYQIITQHTDRLNACIIYDRDFSYSYFGFKILEQSFLKRINGKVVERPQHMLMRIAINIHRDDIDSVIATYNLLSERYYMHTTHTLFSAASPKAQLCSSFLMMMPDDSIDGIFKCVTNCGIISKHGGSIGVNIHNIRAKGTYIAGTNGVSNGLVPMLGVFDHVALFTMDVSTKSTAKLSIYLEPWHADTFEFLNLRKPTGKDEIRARDLSYAMWIPDLFMKRVEANGIWSLMCPHQCPGLADSWGPEFETLYEKYESEGKFVRQVQAQDLWKAMIVSQSETGGPSMLYKDACNRLSNQKHCGTVRGGSFDAEVVAYTAPEEIAVCCQASIAVDMFVSADRKSFDFASLMNVTKVVTKNLDKMIDANYYVLPAEKSASLKHRPIGIGIQGLADAFILLKMPFSSEQAALLNKQIFETIYYGALEASSELAEVNGQYPSYTGSPVSEGKLQFDMWGIEPTDLWNWTQLREKIKTKGVRNSLLVAQLSTTTASQILGDSDSVEPYRAYVTSMKVSSGEFQVVNHHLLRDLTDRGLWGESMRNEIIANQGSIQNISEVPDDLKEIYKTSWEISQKVILNMAADRAPFIDQSQNLNIHIERPSYGALSSMHFYGWKKGLKTGMGQLRDKPVLKTVNMLAGKVQSVLQIQKHGDSEEIDELEEIRKKQEEEEDKNMASLVCSLKNPEACEMCGS